MKKLGQFEIDTDLTIEGYRPFIVYKDRVILSVRKFYATEELALQAGERALRELIAAGNEALKEVGE